MTTLRVSERWDRLAPTVQRVAREHGYAVAVHGSLARDIDLIAVPWVVDAKPPEALAEAIMIAVDGYIRHDENADATDFTRRNPQPKPHGRLAWSIHVAGGTYIDLSVTPWQSPAPEPAKVECPECNGGYIQMHAPLCDGHCGGENGVCPIVVQCQTCNPESAEPAAEGRGALDRSLVSLALDDLALANAAAEHWKREAAAAAERARKAEEALDSIADLDPASDQWNARDIVNIAEEARQERAGEE